MGLDEFMDIESPDSDSNTKEETDNDKLTDREGITEHDNGEVGPRGPIGYDTFDEYEETIEGDVDKHGSLFKYHLPIFPHIEIEKKYDQTKRYRLEGKGQALSCVYMGENSLGEVSREIIMLDTGETGKEECMDVLNDRFNTEPVPSLNVHIYFFSNVRHVAKMAIGDELTDSWGPLEQDGLVKAIYGETYTQQFSEVDSEQYNHKHWNHIEEW